MNPDFSPQQNQERSPQGRAPLSEKDFIQNGWRLTSLPFWLWIFLMAALIGVIYGTSSWYQGVINQEKKHNPFLEVTNRQFSVFLWQFPSFMRVNAPRKAGYLPGFLATSENFNPATAEEFVVAPPDLIFLYHTWHRLLAFDFISRPIPAPEFAEFLEQLPEWQPKNWKDAPDDYAKLIETKKYAGIDNLGMLPETEFPFIVKQAFIGWKNYFKEGPKINELHPTFGQVQAFLEKYPTYARPYWRNIDTVATQHIAGLDYLLGFLNGKFDPDAAIPNDQLSPFLKVALFNAEQAKENR